MKVFEGVFLLTALKNYFIKPSFMFKEGTKPIEGLIMDEISHYASSNRSLTFILSASNEDNIEFL